MIAKIKTRESFAGIVDYAHDYNNDKKKARLIDYKDVCIISNKSRMFWIRECELC